MATTLTEADKAKALLGGFFEEAGWQLLGTWETDSDDHFGGRGWKCAVRRRDINTGHGVVLYALQVALTSWGGYPFAEHMADLYAFERVADQEDALLYMERDPPRMVHPERGLEPIGTSAYLGRLTPALPWYLSRADRCFSAPGDSCASLSGSNRSLRSCVISSTVLAPTTLRRHS